MHRALPFLVASLVAGCRSAGPQLHMQDCAIYSVRVGGDVSASQGKSVPVEMLNNPTVSASQNGDANAVGAAATEESE